MHFGTWGAFGVNITELLREFAANPREACPKKYKSRKVAEDVAAFFEALVGKYPAIKEIKAFSRNREDCDPLCVPGEAVVRRKPRRKPGKKHR